MSWQQQVQAYDDEALIQLGSAGLLRRAGKQLEAGKVELLTDEDGQGVFRVAEQQVILLDAPLERSRCDCSAGGVCVHILAAALYTRELVTPATGESAEQAAGVTAHEALSAYSGEAVMKWAGKPGTRLAARLLASLPEAERRIEEKPGSLEIVLGQEVRCRYILGAGLDGILCDAPESRRKGVIAACLLHWQQQQGDAVEWPDDAVVRTATAPLSEEEAALVQAVRAQLKRMLSAGLMHLPREHENALRTLAWSAQGERLPRLSGLLLRMVGEMVAFSERTAGSDSQRLFDMLIAIWIVCEGLLRAEPASLSALRGRFRRDYTAKPLGPLWCCGAYHYRTPGGAEGISATLWDLQSGEPLRLNMGRVGEASGAFNPSASWQSVIPWQRGRSPEALNGRVLRLSGARVSGDGRLSQSQESVLEAVEEAGHFAEAIEQLGIAQWAELNERMAVALEDEAAQVPPLMIRPREVKSFQIAEHEQRWIGWARDSEKQWLQLSAPVEAIHNERIEVMNKLIAQAPFGLWGIVLELRRDQDDLALVPVSLIMKKGDAWTCLNPDLQYLNPKGRKQLSGWLRQLLGSGDEAPSQAPNPPELATVTRLLDDVRQVLLGAAEIGLDCRYLRKEQVDTFVRMLHTAGAPRLGQLLEAVAETPTEEALVKAQHAFSLAWRKLLAMEKIQAG